MDSVNVCSARRYISQHSAQEEGELSVNDQDSQFGYMCLTKSVNLLLRCHRVWRSHFQVFNLQLLMLCEMLKCCCVELLAARPTFNFRDPLRRAHVNVRTRQTPSSAGCLRFFIALHHLFFKVFLHRRHHVCLFDQVPTVAVELMRGTNCVSTLRMIYTQYCVCSNVLRS